MIHSLNIDGVNNILNNDKLNIRYSNIFLLVILIIIIIVLIIYKKNITYSNILLIYLIGLSLIIYSHTISSLLVPNNIIKLLDSINDNNYKLIEIDNFLSEKECNDLIIFSETKTYEKSKVLSETESILSENRESQQLWILDDDNYVVKKISDFCSKFTNKPLKNMEHLQLVKYDIGGYFKEHYDPEPYFTSDTNDRIYTFIIYLNDNFDGGTTYFKELNKNIIPKKGKAVLFKSLDNNGKLLKKSLHQGSEVTKGIKYMCNKWIHVNKCDWLY